MPRANWGIDAEVIDGFDRETQYAPYTGPEPTNAVYQWQIKVLKFVAGNREKHPQMRVGLELVPRNTEEKKYYRKGQGYFIMMFLSISEKNAFTYAPFCDAIGISGKEFTTRTITDEDGNVKKIGSWRNDGSTLILGQLRDGVDQNNKPRKEIGWVGPVTDEDEGEEYTDDDEEYIEDDEDAAF